MRRTWTILGVADVARSTRWYQSLLGLPAAAPAHDHFGQVVDADGTVLLCLHAWGAHEHPSLASPDRAPPGNGLLLFFRVDDFEPALHRVRALGVPLDEAPHLNPNTRTPEFSLRDPDGYHVTISATETATPDATLATRRRLPHTPAEVFAAFADPTVLGRWWGPDGFATDFAAFGFTPGARWEYVMHGPDGTHHPNVAELRALDVPRQLVLAHVSAPRFVLTVSCREADGGTELSWVQTFEDAALAARLRHIAEPANEQNLDRLAAVLAGQPVIDRGQGPHA
jgi:uncharacterized protein YndB with AHSA1/START domain